MVWVVNDTEQTLVLPKSYELHGLDRIVNYVFVKPKAKANVQAEMLSTCLRMGCVESKKVKEDG